MAANPAAPLTPRPRNIRRSSCWRSRCSVTKPPCFLRGWRPV